MGIYIKGMEMPKNCAECPVNMTVCKRGYEYLLAHPELYDQRAEDCPISYVPATDVAPVRHGLWEKATGMMPPEYCGLHICSECGHYAGRKPPYCGKEMLSDYCPHCGAKMGGDGDV